MLASPYMMNFAPKISQLAIVAVKEMYA